MDQETRRLGRVGDAGRLTDAFPASSAAHEGHTHTDSNAQDAKLRAGYCEGGALVFLHTRKTRRTV